MKAVIKEILKISWYAIISMMCFFLAIENFREGEAVYDLLSAAFFTTGLLYFVLFTMDMLVANINRKKGEKKNEDD